MNKEDEVHIYNGILLSHKKNEIMRFVATWMDLEVIIRKWSQTNTNILCYHLYVESKKMIQMNLFTKQKHTHRFWKQTYSYQLPKGKGGGGDKLRVWDWHIHTTIYKIDNQQGSTV